MKRSGSPADFPPGSTLLLYTDGVFEARNAREEIWGNDALLDSVQRHAAASPQELVDAVVVDLAAHTAGRSPIDDVTLLAFRSPAP